MAFTLVPLVGLALFHDSFGAVVVLGLLLGFAGASFAVGVPFVNRWYPPVRQGAALGVYGMGMIGSVAAGFTGPKIVKAWGLAAPFWIAAAIVACMTIVFAVLARDAPVAPRAVPRGSMFASLRVFRTSSKAWALTLFYFLSFGGFVALFLYLPKMLVSVHGLTKPDAGARAAGFALLVVLARPAGGIVADRIGAERDAHERTEEHRHRHHDGELELGDAEMVLEIGPEWPDEAPCEERDGEGERRERQRATVAALRVSRRLHVIGPCCE
jgi:NNP family nitrate/nitrite transporter-like MFS transporter